MTRIVTKYTHADHRGARITATGLKRQRTIPYDHALGYDGSHRAAAQALADVLGGTLVGPTVPGATNRHRRTWEYSRFRVGDWADRGDLDSREVVEVPDADHIVLVIGDRDTGVRTPPVPACNYARIPAAVADRLAARAHRP